ncbi:11583_t:CDS:2 [Funneliformis mosseae]|uniref:11583_t:CDS:1 n=1 Tax=Funneliformis mosseae TaxID=27381 RepID=A0A9N9EM70_FUNMO|nr:11583_t:CDS:2 [Funneliformis mosseae]
MATEESVLNSFLFNSELADNLTLKQFTNLFPATYRNNPLVKTLYREFQLERNRIRETIRENIVEECKKPEHLENLDSAQVDDNRLTLEQAIDALTVAEKKMSRKIIVFNEHCKRSFEKIKSANDELSDLEYGRIPKGGFGKEGAMVELQSLIKSCQDMMISSENQ